MRFKVLVAARDCVPYLDASLAALAAQTDPAFDVCVVDDASEDPAQWPLIRDRCRREGWLAVRRDHPRGALYNQYDAAHRLEPGPADVLVFYDGDDRFSSPASLARLRTWYERHDPLVTYGSYRCHPADPWVTPAQELPRDVIAQGTYRAFSARRDPDAIWFNHLRSVRWSVFSLLDPARDLCLPDGSWFTVCCDTAVMVPCLELAGGRHRFIPDVLYTYTRDNPRSDCRIHVDEVEVVHARIFATEPYAPLDPITIPELLSEPWPRHAWVGTDWPERNAEDAVHG